MGQHWLFLTLFVFGVVMRVVTTVTLWPAMWNSDTAGYLRAARTGSIDTVRPSGFGFFMGLIPGWRWFWPVTATQHVLGLLLATGIYVVLRRWRVPAWGAALASAPVLLDPLQLSIEHFLLADFLSEFLICMAVLVLAWNRRVSLPRAIVAGLLVGLAADTRSVATPLIVIALGAVLLLAKRRVLAGVALVGAFLVPFGSYVVAYHAQHGVYGTSAWGSRILYARIALYIDCSSVHLPAQEERLCPARIPVDQRNINLVLWNPDAPVRSRLIPFNSMTGIARRFDEEAIRQQPVAYTEAVVRDTLRGFYPTRRLWNDNGFDAQWKISKLYRNDRQREIRRLYAAGLTYHIDRSLARRTTWYSDHIYTPGPLLAACAAFVLFGAALSWRRRTAWEARTVVLFCVVLVFATTIGAAATAAFSWRYQLLQLPLLPFAAALTASLIRVRRHPSCPETLESEHVEETCSEGELEPDDACRNGAHAESQSEGRLRRNGQLAAARNNEAPDEQGNAEND